MNSRIFEHTSIRREKVCLILPPLRRQVRLSYLGSCMVLNMTAVFYFVNLGGTDETKIALQIKFKEKNMNKKGFTLLELLVVVLIIGILAAIALPQYKMAVTKAKVASILPLMRRWKDALQEYKLQHGDYNFNDASDLGVNWPSDWKDSSTNNSCGNETACRNEYWDICMINPEGAGEVICPHTIDNNNYFYIFMHQPDDEVYEDLKGMTTCEGTGTEGEKVCKALGGKLLEDVEGDYGYTVYKLN